MKTETVVILAAAGIALAMVYNKAKKPKTKEVTPGGIVPGAAGYGWRYFDDGVSIGPDGTYYKNGAPVWSPTGVGGDEVWAAGSMTQ